MTSGLHCPKNILQDGDSETAETSSMKEELTYRRQTGSVDYYKLQIAIVHLCPHQKLILTYIILDTISYSDKMSPDINYTTLDNTRKIFSL